MDLLQIVESALVRAIDTVDTDALENALMTRFGDGLVLILADGRVCMISVKAGHFEVAPLAATPSSEARE